MSDDLDLAHNKKLESLKNNDKQGKDMFWPKYGSSIYDDKMINEFLTYNDRYNDRED